MFKTWLEYRGFYYVSGDKIYQEQIEVDAPLYRFPLNKYMELIKETWKVYGPAVRTYLYDRFYGGGHHYIYPWIKPTEIWIESNVYEEDLVPTYMRYAISRYLMREQKLSYPQADTIARCYSTDLRVELRSSGDLPLKSFYPKKNSLTIAYAPPVRDKFLPEDQRTNVELEEFQKVKASLEAEREKLEEPEWKQVFEKLDEVEEDLKQLPV